MGMFVCTGWSTPLRLEIGLRTETNSFAILASSSQLATVEKSPYHSKWMEKANEEHKLVLSPTYPMASPLKKF